MTFVLYTALFVQFNTLSKRRNYYLTEKLNLIFTVLYGLIGPTGDRRLRCYGLDFRFLFEKIRYKLVFIFCGNDCKIKINETSISYFYNMKINGYI